MQFRTIVLTLAFLALGALGYRLGARQNHQPPVQTVTLEDVQVSQIHPAALYVRTPFGKEQHYLIDDLDRNWADSLLQHPKAHWYLQLATSPEARVATRSKQRSSDRSEVGATMTRLIPQLKIRERRKEQRPGPQERRTCGNVSAGIKGRVFAGGSGPHSSVS